MNKFQQRYPGQYFLYVVCTLTVLALSACGGGGGYGGSTSGMYNSSSSYSSAVSSSSSSATASIMSVTIESGQIVPAISSSSNSASASITINATSGVASGTVTLSGVTATAITVNDAFAGNNGPMALTLTQSSGNANVWDISGTLTNTQLADLGAGKLYLLVATMAFPQGELRGQILPSNVTVVRAALSGTQEVPAVTSTITGSIAVTVNTTTKKAAINVMVSGNPTGIDLLTGSMSVNGTQLAALVADNATPGHWWNESVTLTDADITNYNSSKWYANVYTAAHATGEVRGQVAQTPLTLTQLQATIFTPICSGCHSGTGTQLPGVQNLTSKANTYSMLVNVNSLEVPALKRINPNDPDNSYLIQKVEGTAAVGVRMPAGGQLTQAQIDQLRAWVTAGAPNN
jgi:hypothetical protein